jgi:hypothetical protein
VFVRQFLVQARFLIATFPKQRWLSSGFVKKSGKRNAAQAVNPPVISMADFNPSFLYSSLNHAPMQMLSRTSSPAVSQSL